MLQVTLSVPNEKLPLLKDMLKSMGIETNASRKTDSKIFTVPDVADTFTQSENLCNDKYSSWDCYCSELEFE